VAWFTYASSSVAWMPMLAAILCWVLVTSVAIRVLIALTATSHASLAPIPEDDHEVDRQFAAGLIDGIEYERRRLSQLSPQQPGLRRTPRSATQPRHPVA
jgi:hypothetical protein